MTGTANTAYDKSLAVARALMQSVQEQKTELEYIEQRRAAHKRAFRDAFDYLNDMFPPVLSAEYFTVAAKKCNELYAQSNGDKLTHLLLMAVYSYLEREAMEGNNRPKGLNEENNHPKKLNEENNHPKGLNYEPNATTNSPCGTAYAGVDG